jgi:hypothetical protein
VTQLSPIVYLAIFIIGCVFQAGGFWFVTQANNRQMEAFKEKLTETREDMAWIKGFLSKATPNGGKKR